MKKQVHFELKKNLSDLNLKEELTEVYCYLDFNKQTAEAYYNDEIKFPINLIKVIHRHMGYLKLPVKKMFPMIEDITMIYQPKTEPGVITIDFKLKV